MKIAIIKYNAGNIRSVQFSLQRLGYSSDVTDDIQTIKSADRVIFPGVGEAGSTMRYLAEKGLDELITGLTQPVLGICLGLQLMCGHSEEGNTNCMGIFGNEVRKFDPVMNVPHMGWNSLERMKGVLFKNVPADSYVYFVHSFYATTGANTIASCDYINEFSAALHEGNFYATQFHPEKSGETGARILKNFIEEL